MSEAQTNSRISRRSFVIILFGTLAGLFVWMYRSRSTVKSIQEFFGLDSQVRALIAKELAELKNEHFSWWGATVLFFALADWGLRFIVPRNIQFRIINYWSWRIFSHRSIAWKYVNYPSVGDEPICDGLIRSS
jgi:hypothetical protein